MLGERARLGSEIGLRPTEAVREQHRRGRGARREVQGRVELDRRARLRRAGDHLVPGDDRRGRAHRDRGRRPRDDGNDGDEGDEGPSTAMTEAPHAAAPETVATTGSAARSFAPGRDPRSPVVRRGMTATYRPDLGLLPGDRVPRRRRALVRGSARTVGCGGMVGAGPGDDRTRRRDRTPCGFAGPERL
ncbi:hypothetical protein GALL_335110 [mine drainage metagenome]|uniref:Uncharacterized protein n=1 Tax=mine drainage metagenome TaxID=410659 RepID=A0A1J5R4M5_9ZZZZ